MQQKYIDLSLFFTGLAIGIASDMAQYNGHIGVGTIIAPIGLPALTYKAWDLIKK